MKNWATITMRKKQKPNLRFSEGWTGGETLMEFVWLGPSVYSYRKDNHEKRKKRSQVFKMCNNKWN